MRNRVVTAPCLHFVSILAGGMDFDLAEGVVFLIVDGGIANAVLRAQLRGDLIEGGLQVFWPADLKHPAASLFCHFFHVSIAAVAVDSSGKQKHVARSDEHTSELQS